MSNDAVFGSHPARRPSRGIAAVEPAERLLKIPDVARLSNCSGKTVRRWIADGSLIAHRLGSQWRIRPSDYADFLHTTSSRWR